MHTGSWITRRSVTLRAAALVIFTAVAGFPAARSVPAEEVKFIGAYKVASDCKLTVFYDDLSNRLRFVSEDMEVVLTPGLDTAILDAEVVELESRVKLMRGEVQIPLNFVAVLKERIEEKRALRRKKEREAQAQGKKLQRIVLDPGHGGKFPGACAHGLQEKEINLWLACKVKDILLEEGIEVIMTRAWDTELSEDLSTDLDLRCDVANSKKADIFVSIHANGSTNPAATGFEVYIVRPHEDLDRRTEKAASEAPVMLGDLEGDIKSGSEIDRIVWRALLKEYYFLSRTLAERILSGMDNHVSDKNGGVREAGFRVVKWTRCPAVLVEVGYMSNRATARKLATNAYRRKIARGIADGILEFKKEYDATSGFTKSGDKEVSEQDTP